MPPSGTPSGQPAAPADARTAFETAARSFYDAGDQLYGATSDSGEPSPALGDTLRAREEDVAVGLGLTGPQRQARHREFAETVRVSGLEPLTIGQALYEEWTNAQLAAARGAAAPEPSELKAWDEEVRRDVLEQFGLDRGERILAHTDAFIRAHPKLAGVLGVGAIGAKPVLRRQLIEHVRRTEKL